MIHIPVIHHLQGGGTALLQPEARYTHLVAVLLPIWMVIVQAWLVSSNFVLLYSMDFWVLYYDHEYKSYDCIYLWSYWLQSAGDMNDLHVYDPENRTWTNISISASGTPAPPRDSHGFTSTGGKIYVHGGEYGTGRRKRIFRKEYVQTKIYPLIQFLSSSSFPLVYMVHIASSNLVKNWQHG